jgi:hypothetical protein
MAASAPADPGSVMPRLTVDDTPGDGEEQEGRRARLVVSGTLPSLGDYLVVLDCGARRYDVRVILAADPGPEVRRTIADLIGAGCEQGRALGRLEVTTGGLAADGG